MLFNSYIFLFAFLPLVLTGWWSLRRDSMRLLFLTLASYVFYGWWDWRFVPLMLASTTADYIAGQGIAHSSSPKVRRRWLIGSLSFNLLILGFFKYYDFFAASVSAGAAAAGIAFSIPTLNVVLPIGISFYTFNSMSYTIDIYRGLVRPARDFFHFSAFVALFPHLVAGPIVRYSDIENQFAALKKRLSSEQAYTGVFFFVVGLSKKLLIADTLAAVILFDGNGVNKTITTVLQHDVVLVLLQTGSHHAHNLRIGGGHHYFAAFERVAMLPVFH